MDYYLVCSVKKSLEALVFISIRPMSSVYSTKNVVKKLQKNWKKKVEIFLKIVIVLGKNRTKSGNRLI